MTHVSVAVLVALLIVFLLGVMTPVSAHHSFSAMYDENKTVTVKGEITELKWANPHIYYYIDVTDEAGRVTNYAVEGGTPASLQRQGVSRDALKAGEIVTVEGFLARSGAPRINGRKTTFPDGRDAFTGTRNDGAPDRTY